MFEWTARAVGGAECLLWRGAGCGRGVVCGTVKKGFALWVLPDGGGSGSAVWFEAEAAWVQPDDPAGRCGFGGASEDAAGAEIRSGTWGFASHEGYGEPVWVDSAWTETEPARGV